MDQKQTPKINKSQLTTDQLAQLDAYDAAKNQLRELQDIASMAHEAINLLDEQKKTGTKTVSDFGALLIDIRESLTLLNDKQAPEMPDYAKPVVERLSELETALSAAMKVKPQVNVAAPNVNVEPTPIDLSGVEKALQAMPKAFKQAISLIPKVDIPKTDFQPLLDAWEGISEQLLSIEAATRMKPLPGSIKINNTTAIPITGTTTSTITGTATVSDTTLQNLTDQLAHLVATLEAGLPSYDAAGWRQRVIFDTTSNMNTLFAMGSTSGSGAFLTNNIPPDMSNISWGVLRNKITTS